MKKSDLQNIRGKTLVELEKMAGQVQKDVARGRMELAMRRSKNTNIVKKLHRDLAQILTIKNELAKEGK